MGHRGRQRARPRGRLTGATLRGNFRRNHRPSSSSSTRCDMRSVVHAASLLVVLAVLVLPSSPAAAPRGRSGEEVERSPGSGRIRALRGDLTPPSPEAPREIAERFLAGQAARFGMKHGLPDLRLSRTVESPAGRHFRYEQVYRGLPVFDAGAEVHVAADGRVFLARNDYAPGIDLAVSPSRAPAAIAALAIKDFLASAGVVDKKGRARPNGGGALRLANEITPELGIYAGEAGAGPTGAC